MGWTKEADSEAVRSVLGRVRETNPGTTALWQALATDPAALEGIPALGAFLMREPAPLTRAQAEMIGLVVSATNGCGYAVSHHGTELAAVTGNEGLARTIALDYRTADLAARDRVLLDYAVALTCEPSERKLEDVERVREYGFDDASIVRATVIVAWVNLINRVASGLGVELETGRSPWEFGSQK
jgi:uncharacterized peroxidase-related enzyme